MLWRRLFYISVLATFVSGLYRSWGVLHHWPADMITEITYPVCLSVWALIALTWLVRVTEKPTAELLRQLRREHIVCHYCLFWSPSKLAVMFHETREHSA